MFEEGKEEEEEEGRRRKRVGRGGGGREYSRKEQEHSRNQDLYDPKIGRLRLGDGGKEKGMRL